MAFMQYLDIIFSFVCLILVYVYCRQKSWSSSLLPTNWPLLGMTPSLLWNFHCIHEYIANILKQNGGTFMFKGPWFANMDMLFTSDPANVNYISSTNFHNYPKGPEFREIFDILGDGIFNCDSELWELHRKTTMSLLKGARFSKLLEKTIWNNMEKKLMPVLEFVCEHGSKTDLQEIFQRFTFDGIMILLLGHDPQTLSVDFPYNEFEIAFTKSEETIFLRHVLPKCCWKLQKRLRIGNEKHLSDAWKLGDELLYNLIKEKQEKQTKANDAQKEHEEDFCLLTGFMKEYKDQTGTFGSTDRFIKDTLFSLMVAGRDTTSLALTWFFYVIAKSPLIESNIREEIHTQLAMENNDEWKRFGANEVEKLVYLHATFCEVLRLFPPIPINHKVPLETDMLPTGHQVHKNTKIILHFYTMGRMEAIWGQDYVEFKPERWLTKQGGIKHVPSYKFTAFHAGPRTCLGKGMSFILMKMVATAIIYNYNVEVVENHPITHNASVLLQMKYGLKVKLTRRNEVKSR